MLSRRQFLVAGIRGLGAWVVGAGVAGKILRLALERKEPYLVEVDYPDHKLWANLWSAKGRNAEFGMISNR